MGNPVDEIVKFLDNFDISTILMWSRKHNPLVDDDGRFRIVDGTFNLYDIKNLKHYSDGEDLTLLIDAKKEICMRDILSVNIYDKYYGGKCCTIVTEEFLIRLEC